jgi:hypothetical protein
MLKAKKRNITLGTLNIAGAVALATVSGLLVVNSVYYLKRK